MSGLNGCRAAHRVVLIAVDRDDARQWLAGQPQPPTDVVIVTVRSPHGARGATAATVFATPAVQAHPRFEDLVAESLPATASQR